MKRLIYLATVSMLALLIMAPTAMAQDSTMMGSTMMEDSMMGSTMMEDSMMEDSMMGSTMMEETTAGSGASGDLPESGGPAILLPAAALLLGAGILTFAVVRRRA
jgi:pentapeptide MXKDX repeat protein